MSFNALNWAWDQPCPNSRAKLLLTFFANAASRAGGECWPSIATICQRTQMAEATVRKSLRDLVAAGLLFIEERQGHNGASKSNLYRLPVATLEEVQPPPATLPDPPTADLPDAPAEFSRGEPAPPLQIDPGEPPLTSPSPPLLNLASKPSLEPEDRTKKEGCSLRSQRARTKPSPQDLSEWEISFQEWYREYPRKKSPDAARKAFFARLREGVPAAEILTGLRRQSFDDRPEYRPYPASWLNAGKWRDEPDDMFDPALRAAGLTPEDFAATPNSMMIGASA